MTQTSFRHASVIIVATQRRKRTRRDDTVISPMRSAFCVERNWCHWLVLVNDSMYRNSNGRARARHFNNVEARRRNVECEWSHIQMTTDYRIEKYCVYWNIPTRSTTEWKLYNDVKVIDDVSLEDDDAVTILCTIPRSNDGRKTIYRVTVWCYVNRSQ